MAILKKAPAGANVLDLGEARAARAEARAEAGDANPVVKLDVGYVEVKPEFDILIGEKLKAGQIREAVTALLVDPADADAVIEYGLTGEDLNALITFVSGVTVGEAQG